MTLCERLFYARRSDSCSVQRRKLYVVYHFIGLPYLRNVFRRGGLWCASQLRDFGDDFETGSWGSAEKAEAFCSYVACSINTPMGMLTKEKRPVLLELSSPVVAEEDAAFIGKWSSYGDVIAEEARRQTGIEWFDRMFLTDLDNHARPHPGEFLVPDHIPLGQVRRLIFYTEEDREEARGLVRGVELPEGLSRGKIPSLVAPGRFGNKMQSEADP